MQQVSEKELREAIRYALSVQEKSQLVEQTQSYTVNISASEFYDALIAPWINVLKIAKLEAQKTLANMLTLFRVFTTFNRQKLQNIMDNHNDRMNTLNSETQSLIDKFPTNTDMAVFGFLVNPGGYIAAKSNPRAMAKDVGDFFRGAGFGDFQPGELSSPDRNSAARARKREQGGLISKIYRGLNSLFMAGYEPGGAMLLEQDEEAEDIEPFEERDFSDVQLDADGLNLIIDEGGGIPGLKEAQEGMMEDADEFTAAVKTAKQVVDLLVGIRDVQSLDQYMAVLDRISQVSPETGMSSRAEIEQSLAADAKEIASQEGADEEAAKMVLQKQGNSDPTEEDIAAITPEAKEQEIRTVAFGNILAQLRAAAAESAKGIYNSHKETYDNLYPDDIEAEVQQIIDDSPYGKKMIAAGELLKGIEKSASSLGM